MCLLCQVFTKTIRGPPQEVLRVCYCIPQPRQRPNREFKIVMLGHFCVGCILFCVIGNLPERSFDSLEEQGQCTNSSGAILSKGKVALSLAWDNRQCQVLCQATRSEMEEVVGSNEVRVRGCEFSEKTNLCYIHLGPVSQGNGDDNVFCTVYRTLLEQKGECLSYGNPFNSVEESRYTNQFEYYKTNVIRLRSKWRREDQIGIKHRHQYNLTSSSPLKHGDGEKECLERCMEKITDCKYQLTADGRTQSCEAVSGDGHIFLVYRKEYNLNLWIDSPPLLHKHWKEECHTMCMEYITGCQYHRSDDGRTQICEAITKVRVRGGDGYAYPNFTDHPLGGTTICWIVSDESEISYQFRDGQYQLTRSLAVPIGPPPKPKPPQWTRERWRQQNCKKICTTGHVCR